MTVRDIVKATGGRLSAGSLVTVCDPARISTDTRTIRKGDVFLALAGGNFDGNAFVAEAFTKGARGAIVSRSCAIDPIPAGAFVIRVADTTKALQDIAAYHRRRFSIPVIAITGSNGKTTVKDLTAALLATSYRVLRNEGTKNNHIGVPLTLLQLTDAHEICVLELGTNHPGEIAALGKIARPSVAVITTIGPSHLEFLKDLAGVFKEKRSVLMAFDRRRKACAILNGDDPYLAKIRSRSFTVCRYGFAPRVDVRGVVLTRDKAGTRFMVNGKDPYTVPLLGDHNVSNALAAIAVARFFKVSPGLIRAALAAFTPTSMRLNISVINGLHIINDAYNSNPLSMACALDVVRDFPAVSRWVVSGDMLELGAAGKKLHRETGRRIARSGVTGLVTFGALSCHTRDGALEDGMDRKRVWHCATHDEIAAILRRVTRKGDVVLLKGSRSMKMEEVAKLLGK